MDRRMERRNHCGKTPGQYLSLLGSISYFPPAHSTAPAAEDTASARMATTAVFVGEIFQDSVASSSLSSPQVPLPTLPTNAPPPLPSPTDCPPAPHWATPIRSSSPSPCPTRTQVPWIKPLWQQEVLELGLANELKINNWAQWHRPVTLAFGRYRPT